MNTAQQTARVGLFFLLGLALTWVTFETLSDGKIFKERGYTLVAGFDNLKELKTADEVRMAGVKIGSVEATRLAGRRAEAVLRIQPGVKIASDATATIVMAGLIGTNYIGLDLGTPGAPALADGAELRTKVTPDINTIMTELGNLGQKLDGALGSIGDAMKGKDGQPGLFQKIDTLVTDNSAKVTATMSNLQDITTKLKEGEGTLGKLINDPKLHDELLATVAEIKAAATDAKAFVTDTQGILAQVKSGKGTLGTLLYDEESAASIKVTVKNLRDVSDKIARGEGTLGKLLNDDSLYIGVQNTLKKADRAIDGLGDSGPITAVGVVANSLF
jgi:phospholipid/cholesterol/gamma-HCH transport system substrate-binding protein